MSELLASVVPEFVGGLLALLCAFVGAKMATKSGEKLERSKSLRNAYADVFAGYYSYLTEDSDENILLLVTATERAMLICSEKSEKIMIDIVALLLTHPADSTGLGEKMQSLRASAKEDVRHANRKHHRSKVN